MWGHCNKLQRFECCYQCLCCEVHLNLLFFGCHWFVFWLRGALSLLYALRTSSAVSCLSSRDRPSHPDLLPCLLACLPSVSRSCSSSAFHLRSTRRRALAGAGSRRRGSTSAFSGSWVSRVRGRRSLRLVRR